MIQKIAKEEIPAILPVKQGRDTKLRIMLLQLQPGEGLFLPREDWKRKSTPHYIISRIKKTHGYLYEYGQKPDGTGWLFRRVK